MILVSHPTGNNFVRALLMGLDQEGQLDSFHTTISASNWMKTIPGLGKSLQRRNFPVQDSKICVHPWRELVRLVAPQVGLTFLTAHISGWASTYSVYRGLDRAVGKALFERMSAPSIAGESHRDPLTAVYGYEDAALNTFETAKNLELKCFYDLPIAYWQTSQQLLHDEAERYPAWEPTLIGSGESIEKNEAKTKEIELADVVICPSQFVLDSLPEHIRKEKACVVAEFGTPEQIVPPAAGDAYSGKLRILFAGSMSQRKGLADLFQAMKLLKRSDVELVVLGSPILSMDFYRNEFANFIHEPTRANEQVLELMQTCDVFVLPSIVEGRALVQQEAMSCGLPLLATANAGGSDLIEEGQTGFLIPIRSPEAIAEKINWFADNRNETKEMGLRAIDKAAEVTWDSYRKKILDVILPLSGA